MLVRVSSHTSLVNSARMKGFIVNRPCGAVFGRCEANGQWLGEGK
jgi:hypothetical protein